MADRTFLLNDIRPVLFSGADKRNSSESLFLVIEEGQRVRLEIDRDRPHTADEFSYRTLRYRLASAVDGPRHLKLDELREDLCDGGLLSCLIDEVMAGHRVTRTRYGFLGSLDDNATYANHDIQALMGCYTGQPDPSADRRATLLAA